MAGPFAVRMTCALVAILTAACSSTPPIPTSTSAPPTAPPFASSPAPSASPSPTPLVKEVGPLELEECDPLGYIPCEQRAAVLRISIAGTGAALTYSSEFAAGRRDRPSEWNAAGLGLGGWSLDILQRYDSANGILLGGDGSWHFAEAVSLPSGETAVPSFDGSLVYVFDATGHHVRTVHGILGVDLLLFEYDGDGRLLSAKGSLDSQPIDFTVERAVDGAISGISGLGGVETRIDGDGMGHIGGINHPDGGSDVFVSDDAGLIKFHLDPAGGFATFDYDDQGRLGAKTDADGVVFTYQGTLSDNELATNVVPAIGEQASYRSRRAEGGVELSYVAPGGSTTTMVRAADGRRTLSLPDGRTVTLGAVADPRWGFAAPILTPVVEVRPDGVTRQTDIQVETETEPGDPLAVTAWSRATSIDGDTYLERFETTARAIIAADPLGLETTSAYDDRGRLIAYRTPGQPAAGFTYDEMGRLAGETHGSGAAAALTSYTYGPNGGVDVTRPDGVTESLIYDASGRLIARTAGDGSNLLSTYDSAGRRILVRPGGQQSTTLGYSPAGRLTAFIPPVVTDDSSYELRSYDVVGRLEHLSGPGTRAVSFSYDEAGRLTRTEFDLGQTETTYDPATGQPATMSAPGAVMATYDYVGSLRSAMAWSGPIRGDVRLEFDARGRPVSEVVNSGTPVQFAYDAAGRLTSVGSVAVERAADSGLPVTASVGGVQVAWERDANGFVTGTSATFGGNQLIGLDYERDAFGRITRLTESSPARQKTIEYGYDSAGRLAEVAIDGAMVEKSSYDRTGNRVSVETQSEPVTADYDARNRLQRWSDVNFDYEADGTLARRLDGGATTTYNFDDLGGLREVVLPDGRRVDYLVDGSGQPIGRRVDGQLVAAYLYRPDGPLVAQLDATGQVLARFTRDDAGKLLSMERDGKTYVFVTDGLGSPRLVVESASGEVAQAIDYDAWGRVLSDSNPGFQPFGFAGGLLDADTGLLHFGAREYDPTTGRWIEPDPMRFESSDANLYAYAGSDPVNRSDPSGLGEPPESHFCSPEEPCTKERWHPLDDGTWEVCRPAGGGQECWPWYGPDPVPGEPPPSGGSWPPVWPPPPPAEHVIPPPAPAPPDPAPPGKSWFCKIVCFPPGGGICVFGFCSAGDPHLRTADGVAMSFQGAGEYLMTTSADGSIVIQARQEPPQQTTLITITTALAASVAGDRIGVYLDEEARLMVNGEALTDVDATTVLPNGGSITRHGTSFVFEWPDGSRLAIEDRGNHLDYGFRPDPAVAPTLTGLMGTPNGDVADDLVSRDRALTLDPDAPDFFAQLHGPFGDSWRITQNESLFDYGPGESTATFTRPDIPSAISTTDSVDPTARAAAELLCRAAGVTSEPTLSDCILDVGLTGDPSYATSAAAVEASRDSAPPATVPIPMSLGQTVAGSISSPDEVDRYTFAGAAGQAVYLDALGACATELSWKVRAPSGVTSDQLFVCKDVGRYELTETGTFTVELFAPTGSDDTGGYVFVVRLASPPAAPMPISYGQAVTGEVAQIGDQPSYSFEGQTGDVVSVDASGECIDGLSYRIIEPGGTIFASESICADSFPRQLPANGTYIIVVVSTEAVTGAFSFVLTSPP